MFNQKQSTVINRKVSKALECAELLKNADLAKSQVQILEEIIVNLRELESTLEEWKHEERSQFLMGWTKFLEVLAKLALDFFKDRGLM
ncbi:hypothetical protein H8E77_30850 [bacterium]|nr:hypothetical protein [bacterium]